MTQHETNTTPTRPTRIDADESETPTTLGSDVIRILERAWADIRHHNPDMAPHVVFRTGSGRAKGSLVLGSITVRPSWHSTTDPDASYHELFIAAETLAAGPRQVLQTLIHEGVHSTAEAREIKDTSRQYRYHNRRFRTLAEEAGLEWAHTVPEYEGKGARRTILPRCEGPTEEGPAGYFHQVEAPADASLGFSQMTLTPETEALYEDTLRNLQELPVTYAPRTQTAAAPKKRPTVVVFPAFTALLPYEYHELGLSSAEWVRNVVGADLYPTDPQRMGVQVYEGLVDRGLLAEHFAYID